MHTQSDGMQGAVTVSFNDLKAAPKNSPQYRKFVEVDDVDYE